MIHAHNNRLVIDELSVVDIGRLITVLLSIYTVERSN